MKTNTKRIHKNLEKQAENRRKIFFLEIKRRR
jgi:hypothetical protein